MPNNANVIAKFSEPDKAALREVALRLCQGNQSETLRVLVRTTLQVLKEQEAQGQTMIRREERTSDHEAAAQGTC